MFMNFCEFFGSNLPECLGNPKVDMNGVIPQIIHCKGKDSCQMIRLLRKFPAKPYSGVNTEPVKSTTHPHLKLI